MPSEGGVWTPPVAGGAGPVRRGWPWVVLIAVAVLVPFALVSFFPLVLLGIGVQDGAPVWGLGGGALLLGLLALAGGVVRSLARQDRVTEVRLGVLVAAGSLAWCAAVLAQPYL